MRVLGALFFVLLVLSAGAFVGVGTLPAKPDPDGKVALPFFTIAPSGAHELPATIDPKNVISFGDLDESVHRLDLFTVVGRFGEGTGGRLEIVLRQTPKGAYVAAMSSAGDGQPTEFTFSRWDGLQHATTLAKFDDRPLDPTRAFRLDVVLDGPRFVVQIDDRVVLTASDDSYDRGAVFVRAKRGSLRLDELIARGVGPDGESYLEHSRGPATREAVWDRALLLGWIAAFTFALGAWWCARRAGIGVLLDATMRALAVGLSPALIEYSLRPDSIAPAYVVAGVIGQAILHFRLRKWIGATPVTASRFGFVTAALVAVVVFAMTTVQYETQDPILADLATKTAATNPVVDAGPTSLEPGNRLAFEGPFADAIVRFSVALDDGALFEMRTRANARRASGVALVLSTDESLGCGFFRQDVTHDEAIGPRARAIEPGRETSIEIEFRGPSYRAMIDGITVEAVDGNHVSGSIGFLVPRGRARVTDVSIEPIVAKSRTTSAWSMLGVLPTLLWMLLCFLILRFPAKYAFPNALGLAALASVPFVFLRGSGVELRDLLIAALVSPCVLIVSLQCALSRMGALRFVSCSVGVFVIAPVLAFRAAADARVGKDLDHLGRCEVSLENLAILHPKVRQLNDWFAWHEFRGRRASLTPLPGRPRIVALGSSSTWGFGLPDGSGEDWPARLEIILQRRGHDVEVLNAGVPGGVADTLFLYFEHVLVHYRPNIVTLSLTHNDAYELTQLDTRRWLEFQTDVSPVRRLMRMILLTREKLDGRGKLVSLREALGTGPESSTAIWRRLGFLEVPPAPVARFEAAMRRFANLARAHGIRLVFVQEPLRSDRPFIWKDEFRAVMEQIGAEYDFPVARPQERLRVVANNDSLFVDDVHPTGEGYRIVAEAMADALLPELFRLAPPK